MNIEAFYKQQIEAWPTAAENYGQLKSVVSKSIDFEGFKIDVQFNPERIRSTAAKVDSDSIGKRPCFLCAENRPEAQQTLDYQGKYSILVNPYPVAERHLTIPENCHQDQKIEGRIGDMLALAADLNDYTLLYNGPKSGASAPDHFHFQAIKRNIMPFERDFRNFRGKTLIKSENEGNILNMRNYLRKVFIFESKNPAWIEEKFNILVEAMRKIFPSEPEPGMNILLWNDGETRCLSVFPRSRHRPRQFFQEGGAQIMISPGAVDMAGTLITARQADFDRIDALLLADIFEQVSIDDDAEQGIVSALFLP
ncbi:MAG: DUF4922 domain-containing protein [Dysgonamonadaceae bacterium]|jgi:hypothetical protein|nr:DUF4922 domain-containing protein [Dysgonamonadaceae bacterium]